MKSIRKTGPVVQMMENGNKKHCIFMGCCAMLSVVNRVILNHLMAAPNTINPRLRETMMHNCERLC